MKVLQKEDLLNSEWEEKSQKSVEALQMQENTDAIEAQEALLNFILNLGGVREDVYEYLLTPHFSDTNAVAAVRTLLCYAAPVEWMMLSVEALKKDAVAGVMYVDEITTAFKNGVPLEVVKSFLEKSKTAFDMCQYRIKYERKCHDTELCDNMSESYENDNTEHRDRVTGSGKEAGPEPRGNLAKIEYREEDMAAVVRAAVSEAMHTVIVEMKQAVSELHDSVTQSEKVFESEHRDRMTGSEKEFESEHRDRMAGSGKEAGPELCDRMTGSEKEFESEHRDSMAQSEEGKEVVPDFPDGSKEAELGIIVKDLEEERERMDNRVSFFHILLNRHMKKAFLKLDEKAQVSKIFEIMVQQRYSKVKIMAIKKLMDGGMQKEFIFSLLEKDLSEEELQDLCETLLEPKEA